MGFIGRKFKSKLSSMPYVQKVLKEWSKANNFKNIFTKVLVAISVILLLLMSYNVLSLVDAGNKLKLIKRDYYKLHSVEYGLFNSYTWANKFSTIVEEKINEFELTSQDRTNLKPYIDSVIDILLVEAHKAIKENNRGQRGWIKSIIGSAKQEITDSIIDIHKLRQRVPEFAYAIMHELDKPKNQQFIKEMLIEKLQDHTDKNFKVANMGVYNEILNRYYAKDYKSCNKYLTQNIKELDSFVANKVDMVIVLAILLILVTFAQGVRFTYVSLIVATLGSVTLLWAGIKLPMMDIEASIEKLNFIVLDKSIIFENQNLFYKSVSVSDLVELLMQSDTYRMVFVGVLLTTFSIVFPIILLDLSQQGTML